MQCKRDPRKITFVHWKNGIDPLGSSLWYFSAHLLAFQEPIWIGDDPRCRVSLNFPQVWGGSKPRFGPGFKPSWLWTTRGSHLQDWKAAGHGLQNLNLPCWDFALLWLMALAPAPPRSPSSWSVDRSALQRIPQRKSSSFDTSHALFQKLISSVHPTPPLPPPANVTQVLCFTAAARENAQTRPNLL